MKGNELNRSISEVNDDALLRTEVRKPLNRSHHYTRFITASLVLVFGFLGFPFLFCSESTKDATSSWFVITTYAEDGALSEVGLNDGIKSEEDAVYHYYDTPDRPEFQLSQEQLDAPTDVLIDAILDYPYLVEFFTSSGSTDDAYNSIRESFNGFAELEKRTDAASVMLSKFADAAISTSEDNMMSAMYLQAILNVPSYFNHLSASEVATYIQVSEECTFITDASVGQSAENIPASAGTYSDTSVAFTVNGFSYTRSSTDGSTTSGTKVPLYSALSDYTSEKKKSLAEQTADIFNITLLGNATSKYNCHSYAWHQKTTSNVSWLVDPYPYILDDHCTNVSTASVGSIAVYYDRSFNRAHSAVVKSVNGNNIVCQSKWGANGLFEHDIENVPSGYYYDSTQIKVAFFEYTRKHSCSVKIDNAVTHTRTCTVCGWTVTEAHVENARTGRCITCGLKGPFIISMSYIPDI